MRGSTNKRLVIRLLCTLCLALILVGPIVAHAADITHAQKAAKTVSVKFYGNGGLTTTRSYTVGNKYGSLPAGPSRTGYNFDGWYTSGTGGTKITPSSTVSASYTSLYAHYKAKTYTVTFNANGGSCSTKSKPVTYDSTYGSLPTPTRNGYTFVGWYTSSDGGNQRTSSSKVTITSNTTLYAHWSARPYTVTFDAKNGSCSTKNKTVYYNNTYGTLPSATKTGYNFDGWYTSGGTKISPSTKVTITSNQTLYAHWSAKPFTVAFNANGGSCSTTSKTVYYDSTYGSLPTPTRTGFTFKGWFTAIAGGTQISASTKVKITSAQTLYAQWTPDNCTITFDVNGGNGQANMTSLTVEQGSVIGTTLDNRTPGAPNYMHFAGWYDAITGGTQYTSSSRAPYSKTLTLYARWEPNSYWITFNKNASNGVSGVMVNMTCLVGTSYNLNGNAFSRDGYKFTGWNTKADGSGVPYADGERISNLTYTHGDTVTLYAQWEEVYCTIYFDVNGGSGQSNLTSLTVQQGATIGSTLNNRTPGAPVNKHFVGWYDAKTGGKKYTSGSKAPFNTSLTLYARYEQNTYTIVFNQNATGVSGIMENLPCTVGSSFNLTLSTFTLRGYEFDCWNTKADGSGTNYADGAKVSDLSTKNGDTVTLYAKWKKAYCEIVFDVNGGYGQSNMTSLTVQQGATIGTAIDYRVPGAPENKCFLGWYDAKVNGNQYTNTSQAPYKKNLTLYARWGENSYTIVFNQNAPGVTGTMENLPCLIGSSRRFPTCTFSLRDSLFMGWNTKADGTGTHYDDGALFSDLTTKSGETVILYAEWKSELINVTFAVNGVVSQDIEPITVKYGEEYGLLPEGPTLSGFKFKGWYTEPYGGSLVRATTLVTTKEDHTLYAHWDTHYTTTFKYTSFADMVTQPYEINFIDFFRSSYDYQHDLMLASLKTAMAAFDATEADETVPRDDNIRRLMKNLDFNNIDSHYGYPTYMSIGHEIASRQITNPETGDTATLILVALRGAGYGNEWGGNFDVYTPLGSNMNHHGFEVCANQVLSSLNTYINEHKGDFEKTVKVWVVGYSRAAATTNLVCSKLIKGTGAVSMSFKSTDIFGFGFETPRCTTDSGCHDERFNGIKSLINPIDFVPMVAMNNGKGWKYQRYGITYMIPLDDSSSKYNAMTYEYARILRSYGKEGELSTRLGRYQDSSYAQNQLLTNAFTKLGDNTGTPKNYYDLRIQAVLIPGIAEVMGLEGGCMADDIINIHALLINNAFMQLENLDDDTKEAKQDAAKEILTDPYLDALLWNMAFGPIKYSHYPELCLSWLTTCESFNTYQQ